MFSSTERDEMSLVQQIKRAAINHGIYKGNVDDNWEPADRLMYHRLCTRFHGHYSDHPSRANQSKTFLEWLDKYKDPEYSEDPYVHSVVNPGGIDLRQLIPDRQTVNTEGVSRQEAKARDAMVNENAIKLPPPPKKVLIPDPKDVVKQEANNELSDKNSLQSSSEAGNETGNNESGNDDSAKSDNGQNSSQELVSTEQKSDAGSGEQEKTADPAGNTSPPREAAKPAKLIPSNKPAPIVSGDKNTIKTR
jgi:hypothetical protein